MATTTVRSGAVNEDLSVVPPLKMSWSSIFGGAVAALALWLTLYALGLALGLSTVNPEEPSSFKASSIFTGIWSLLVPLIALFVGGMVSSRGSGARTRMGGAMQGLVMWAVTTLVGAWLLANILSALVGGVASVGKSAVQMGAGAVSSAVEGAAGNTDQMTNLANSFGLNADDALRPVNERLAAEGKPAVTATQLEAATKDVLREGVRQGRFDRALLTQNLAERTQLTQTDAEEIATRVEKQFNDAKAQMSAKLNQAARSVETGALKAADATGKAFWGIFGALFLGMVAAIGGAVVGVSRRQRAFAEAPRPTRDLGARREVYP